MPIPGAHRRGEQVILVDDILRTGSKLSELKQLLEPRGATVVMPLAVIIYQPTPATADFGTLPVYYLAKLEVITLMRRIARCVNGGVPLKKVAI